MPGLNPFSGLGRFERYIRWNRFRGVSWQQTQKNAMKKFGTRYGKNIQTRIADLKLLEGTANRLRQSGESRDISTLDLPLGQNQKKNLRVSGKARLSPVLIRGKEKSGQRTFTFDVPRKGTKRNLITQIRNRLIDEFMSYYDIASKYRPDFRRKFRDLDITDIEGI